MPRLTMPKIGKMRATFSMPTLPGSAKRTVEPCNRVPAGRPRVAKSRISGYRLGVLTAIAALGTGYLMQFGFALPERAAVASGPVEVTDIKLTSSAAVMPSLPLAGLFADTDATPAALMDDGNGVSPLTPESAPLIADCTVSMQATAAAGALVTLTLDAPCHGGDRVTLHHQGVKITETMSEDGMLKIGFPALAEKAFFMASFVDGTGATALTDVPAMPFYDRAVLQWKGESGLGLHAREFSDAYFETSHVWAEQLRSVADAATGSRGFMLRLGDQDAPDGLRAEVYSFPSGTARQGGDILLTVEAEVTSGNCNRTIEAQIMQIRMDSSPRARDLTLDMPGCDGAGDFLVLKNLIEDLTIASN